MTRTFHPVGQGAFYSEQFYGEDGSGFRIVYDCGTKTSKEKVDPVTVVQNAFKDYKPIEILFISHFDKDHVSMIKELLKQCTIKRVVLPLLPVEETAVLQAHYRHEGNTIGEHLLAEPAEFLKGETRVLRVEPTENGGNEQIGLPQNHAEESLPHDSDSDVVIQKPKGERVDAEPGNSVSIPSGARLFVPRYSWCYIPHNYEYPQRHQALLNALADRPDIDRARLGDASYIALKFKELNDVYKTLKNDKNENCGNINENSMLVYSGPWQRHRGITRGWRELTWDDCKFNCSFEDRPACIYSGDSDFNKVKINEVYKRIWENVGMVQIPHHGSARSFSAEFLDESNRSYLCPMSTGRQYRHPSSHVLKEILVKHSLPLIVDECLCSKVTQHIWSH